MASDDPEKEPEQVSLPTLDRDRASEPAIEAHLAHARQQRHLKRFTSQRTAVNDIYLDRIRAHRDTVTQEWFDPPPAQAATSPQPRPAPLGSTDHLLKNVEEHVKFSVKRAGSKATDTLRKLTARNPPRPEITLDDIPLVEGGVPMQLERTNSSLNTIPLPAFDLARYRSTSSRSTLSTVDFLPDPYPTSPYARARSPRVSSPSSDPDDVVPPVRVPTPPPFPCSLLQASFSSPSAASTPAHSLPASPFLNTLASLPPLSEHPSKTPTMTSSPTSSLARFPLHSPLSLTEGPPSASNLFTDEGSIVAPRRTLTIDDHSPPSRRDSKASRLAGRSSGSRKHSILHHLRNPFSPTLGSNGSEGGRFEEPRPSSPPSGGLVAPSSPSPGAESERAAKTRRRRARDELNKLLILRSKKLGHNPDDPLKPRVGGREPDDATSETTNANTRKIESAIVERLKLLGALVDETEKVETDTLWEHQRGLLVFGLPKFSSAALFQFDPSVWTDETLKASPYTPHDFPCRPYWRWRDSEFMVDMGGDCDEEGWSYAVFFHSKHWRGEPSLLRAFVRRRRWIRTRIYIPLPAAMGSQTPNPPPPTTRDDRSLDQIDRDDEQEEPEFDLDQVRDLKSACECLPLSRSDKLALYESVSSTSCTVSTSTHTLPRQRGSQREPSYEIPPTNPFIPFRLILEHAQHESRSGSQQQGGGPRELVWRQGVREINETRVRQVMKRVARIDRERLHLWKVWLRAIDVPPQDSVRPDDDDEQRRRREEPERDEEGLECREWNEYRIGERSGSWTQWLERHQQEQEQEEQGQSRDQNVSGKDWRFKDDRDVVPEDFAVHDRSNPGVVEDNLADSGRERDQDRIAKPDLEDVWDLLESRLDNILALFDYHLTRLSFLRLLVSTHPLASTPFPSSNHQQQKQPQTHKHEGYDLPFEQRRKLKQLEWERRLRWVLGVKESIARMEGHDSTDSTLQPARDMTSKDKRVERTRSERRVRKGKQKAIDFD
ncbi:uncharacterized protein JCM15063_005499 [Sporobolomyces koalae]|uniref:uncharacterized protein n=1 Tax=Sporobolomyces koalae TaxID=500713 RepID=UPI00316B4D99